MQQLELKTSWRAAENGQAARNFHDFLIDGASLLERLAALGYEDYISVLGCDSWANAQLIHQGAVEELLGEREPGLPYGFIALFICPECGDQKCGLIKMRMRQEDDRVIWTDFAYDNFAAPPTPIPELGPFTFETEQYIEAIQSAELCA